MTHRIAASPPLRILALGVALITAALLLLGLAGTGQSARPTGSTSMQSIPFDPA